MARIATTPAPLAIGHRPLRDGNSPTAATSLLGTTSRGTISRESAHTDDEPAPRVWKAFHARQAFLERERQYKRKVYVDPLLWGEALGGKLSAYIEELRRNDSTQTLAEAAASRSGGRRAERPRGDGALQATDPEPRTIVFCDDGEEYVADFFGARGDFERVYQRRNGGLDARSWEGGGRAGERERERAGIFRDEVQETRRDKRAREKRDAAPGIPWEKGTRAAAAAAAADEISIGSSSFFADDVAAGLSALRKDGREEETGGSSSIDGGGERRTGVTAHDHGRRIGPDSFRLVPEEVERAHMLKMEEQAKKGGAGASLSDLLATRLIPVGGNADGARKLRGIAALERKQLALAVSRDRYAESVAFRRRHGNQPSRDTVISGNSGGGGGGGHLLSSVASFKEFHLKSALAAGALPAVGCGLDDGEPPTGGQPLSESARRRRQQQQQRQREGGEGRAGGERSISFEANPAETLSGTMRGAAGLGGTGVTSDDKIPAQNSQTSGVAGVTAGAGGSVTSAIVAASTTGGAIAAIAGARAAGARAVGATAAGAKATAAAAAAAAPTAVVVARAAVRATTAAAGANSTATAAAEHSAAQSTEAGGKIAGAAATAGAAAAATTATATTSLALVAAGPSPGEKPGWRSTKPLALPSLNASPLARIRSAPPSPSRVKMLDSRPPLLRTAATAATAAAAAVTALTAAASTAGLPPWLTGYGQKKLLGSSSASGGVVSAGDSALPVALAPSSAVSGGGAVVTGGIGGGGGRRRGRGKRRRKVGNAARYAKMDLGSVKKQQEMTPETRTTFVIGACEWGDLEALERLLELGASPLDPYSPNIEGTRCVFCQFFLFLLQVGAGLRPQLASDDSAHERALDMLIKSELDSDARFLSNLSLRDADDRGFSLLHHAAAFGNASKTGFLLRRGVDPDVRAAGRRGETALSIAARRGQRGHIRVAAALLEAGADLFATDANGMTALHHAAEAGRRHMCHYLLLVGAKKGTQDDAGRTPPELCRGKHPRAYAVMRAFVEREAPLATVVDFMEKVEVHGLNGAAARLRQAAAAARNGIRGGIGNRALPVAAPTAAPTAAVDRVAAANAARAATAILGDSDEGSSMASWNTLSLSGPSDGVSRDSVMSLGSLDDSRKLGSLDGSRV